MDVIIISNILKAVIAFANFYLILMFMMAILNLLGAFGVVNLYDGALASAYRFLRIVIDPALIFLNRFVPRIGVIDLSFLVLVVLLWILVDLCTYWLNSLYSTSFAF